MPERTTPFTWIVKNKLAAGWWPESKEIDIYKKEGIKVVVNCSEFDNKREISKYFTYYHFNIPDFGTPTSSQIKRFLEISEKHLNSKEPMVVHCVAGCGRTGQFIVAWAAYNGYLPERIDPVRWIRKIRPCSLETKEQKNLARTIAEKYRK